MLAFAPNLRWLILAFHLFNSVKSDSNSVQQTKAVAPGCRNLQASVSTEWERITVNFGVSSDWNNRKAEPTFPLQASASRHRNRAGVCLRSSIPCFLPITCCSLRLSRNSGGHGATFKFFLYFQIESATLG
jgi:hypothetical protein